MIDIPSFLGSTASSHEAKWFAVSFAQTTTHEATRLAASLAQAVPGADFLTQPALLYAGLAAVAVPIAIHLLFRIRRRPVPWGAMRFLLEANRKRKSRQRIEQWLLLAARCLLLALLGAALAGPLLRNLAAGDRGGRQLHLVLDAGLSTRTQTPDGTTRFQALAEQATSLLDQAQPGDRVTLWRAAEPVEPLWAGEWAADSPQAVASILENTSPGYGRSALPEALAAAASALRDAGARPGQSHVVVLSDLSRSAVQSTSAPDPAARALGQNASVRVLPSTPGVANFQVAALEPARGLLVVDGATFASVSARVELARFGQNLQEQSARLNLELLGAQGEPLDQTQRVVTFSPAERTQTLYLELPLPDAARGPANDSDPDEGTAASTVRAQPLTLRATLASLSPDRPLDALTEDNQALAVLSAESEIDAVVVDAPGRDPADRRPALWARLALAPDDQQAAFVVRTETATGAEPLAWAPARVAVIPHPARLRDEDWNALAARVRAGAVAWVFADPAWHDANDSANPTNSASRTAPPGLDAMAQAFGLAPRPGAQPRSISVKPSANPDDNAAEAFAPVPGRTAPESLRLLAAEWDALISPLRAERAFDPALEPGETWLQLAIPPNSNSSEKQNDNTAAETDTAGASAESTDGALDLITRYRVGRGGVIFVAVSLDEADSNLPVLPVFPALLQDATRAALAEAAADPVWYAGRPAPPGIDPAAVLQAERLHSGSTENDPAGLSGATPGGDSGASGGDSGGPGVYRDPTDPARRIVVQPDPDAGDTAEPAPAQTARFFDAYGPWSPLPPNSAGAGWLTQRPAPSPLGWELLWIVLAIVILEAWIARWVSHATLGEGAPLLKQIFGHLRGGASQVENQRQARDRAPGSSPAPGSASARPSNSPREVA